MGILQGVGGRGWSWCVVWKWNGNVPKSIAVVSNSLKNGGIVFDDLEIMFGEDYFAIVVTEFAQRQ